LVLEGNEKILRIRFYHRTNRSRDTKVLEILDEMGWGPLFLWDKNTWRLATERFSNLLCRVWFHHFLHERLLDSSWLHLGKHAPSSAHHPSPSSSAHPPHASRTSPGAA